MTSWVPWDTPKKTYRKKKKTPQEIMKTRIFQNLLVIRLYETQFLTDHCNLMASNTFSTLPWLNQNVYLKKKLWKYWNAYFHDTWRSTWHIFHVDQVEETMYRHPFKPNIAFHIKTSYFICNANQMTGFYMRCNTELKWFK